MEMIRGIGRERGIPNAPKAEVAKTRASPKMARMGKVASPRVPTSMGKVVETSALAKAGIRGILRPGKEMMKPVICVAKQATGSASAQRPEFAVYSLVFEQHERPVLGNNLSCSQ